MKINHLLSKRNREIIIYFLICIFNLISRADFAQTANDRFVKTIRIIDPTVSIVYNDTLTLPSFTEFDLPVIMQTGHDISAISLGLYFPREYLELDTMELTNVPQGYYFSVIDSLFILAWSDVNPISVADGGTFLILKMKTLDLSELTGTIKLSIWEFSEFADSSANAIDNVVLEIPEIEYFLPEPEDSIDGNYVRIYPNPFNDYASVNFFLKADSKVKISISNSSGKLMSREETSYPEGTYEIKLYAMDYASGIYLLKFEIDNSEGTSSKLFKILVN